MERGGEVKNRGFGARLGFALAGLRACWRGEASFRSQSLIGGAVLGVLCLLRPAPVWWALVAIMIVLVLALEAMNSAVERLIDHLHPAIHPEIGAVKDMLAGGVLLASVGAVAVGVALVVDLLLHP